MAQLSGLVAEGVVAEFLEESGYKILARNWKTAVCEIDIVAEKAQIVYFVEVKYRKTESQGSGFNYILPKKLKQMEFAARVWCQQYGWDGDSVLAAAEASPFGINLVELT